MNLYYFLFGWRKASRCKKLIKRVQCRLKLLKNKRESIKRHLHDDIVQLLKSGQDQIAFGRIEQLFMDQNIVSAYDLLDHFCEFIIINLPYIRQHKDCPNDINEAASSLLYASARFGDLPELQKLRKLFGNRYGQRFAMTAVELLPGNLVNHQIIQKLSVKSISDDVKFRLMKEISRDNGLDIEPYEFQVHEPSFEICDLDWDKKVSGIDIKPNHNNNGLQDLTFLQKQMIVKPDTPLSQSKELVVATKTEKFEQLDPVYESEIVHDRISSQSNSGTSCTSIVLGSSLPNKMEQIAVATSESSIQLSDRNIVCLDDVEEIKPSKEENDYCKDQRLFMFKSPYPSSITKYGEEGSGTLGSYHGRYNHDPQERPVSSEGKTSSRSTVSKKRKTSRRRLKRRYCTNSMRSVTNDVECAIYYYDSRHQRKKNRRTMSVEEIRSISYTNHQSKISTPPKNGTKQEICYEEMGEKNQSLYILEDRKRFRSRCSFNCEMDARCSLDHPCYFVTSDHKDDRGSPTPRQLSGEIEVLEFSCHKLPQGESKERRNKVLSYDMNENEHEMGNVPSSDKLMVVRDCKGIHRVNKFMSEETNRQNEESEEIEISPCTPKFVCPPPYLRTTTMPIDRPKRTPTTENFLRFSSFQFQHYGVSNSSFSPSCGHIHPKLPDYDHLEAKFRSIKKERTSSK